MAEFKDMTASEFANALAKALETSQEREKLLARLVTSAINMALENRDSSRLNALASAFAGASEWQKMKNFCLYASGGISLQIVSGKPVFVACPEKSCLHYTSKDKAWEIVEISHFQEVIQQWRTSFRALHYKALNPTAPAKPLRLELLRSPYTRLRNNPDRWDASQRQQIAKALDALAVIFGD